MKPAIWSNYYHELSPEDAVREFIKNGIYASELSDEHGAMLLERGENVVETGRAFSEFLQEHGFDMTQGHLHLNGKSQREYILKAGKQLRAIHIADNEGQWDQHLMPFTSGKIDFFEVVSALREIGYDGLFNLEIPEKTESHLSFVTQSSRI